MSSWEAVPSASSLRSTGRLVSWEPSPGAISRSRISRASSVWSGESRVQISSAVCRDGAVHAARRLVCLHGERPAAAPPPSLPQGVGEQRQTARLAAGLLHKAGGQLAFDDQSGRLRGPDDGLAELGRAHRSHHQVGLPQSVGELAVLGAARSNGSGNAPSATCPS